MLDAIEIPMAMSVATAEVITVPRKGRLGARVDLPGLGGVARCQPHAANFAFGGIFSP
jgi:hypothetical protein